MPTLVEISAVVVFFIAMVILIPIVIILACLLIIMVGRYLKIDPIFNRMKKINRGMIFSQVEDEVKRGTFIEYIHFTTSHYTIWWTPDDLVTIFPTLQEIIRNQSYLNEGEAEFNLIFDNYLHLENGTAFFIRKDSLPDDFFEKHKNDIVSLHHRTDKLWWTKELLESSKHK